MTTATQSNRPALIQAIIDAFKLSDLRSRILFTLFILVVFRFFAHVPVPGVDKEALQSAFDANPLLGFIDIFSGGALRNMSIAALGVYPYITASIIIQILTPLLPQLKELAQEGEAGRKAINRYTHYLTVPLAFLQGYGQINLFSGALGQGALSNVGFGGGNSLNTLAILLSMTAGTMILVWLGELVTEKGIGNGISLIIFSGIVAEIPRALVTTFELGRTGAISTLMIIFIFILLVVTILFIVFMERALRKILINYPKRQMGNKMYGGESSHLPLKINSAGVIPAIFASALLLLPVTFSNFNVSQSETFLNISSYFSQGQPLYMILYASGIIFFTFFYTSITFNPTETAENLRKYGGFIPGIRPGESTAIFLDTILTRLTSIGALYLTLVCLMPEFLIANYPIPFYLGGTSILIVVVVAMDTVTQVQTRLMSSQYESFIKKTKFGK